MTKFWGLRAAAAIAFVCLGLSPVFAQYATVNASHIGGTSTPAANATVYWMPIFQARIGSTSGQVLGMPATAQVTSGAFSLAVPDAHSATPATCYAVTVVDNVTGLVLLGSGLTSDGHVVTGGGYGCVQPAFDATWCSVSGGVTTCNFDSYVPSATTTLWNGANATFTVRGTWSNLTAYITNDIVIYNGSSYVSTVTPNLANTPPASGWTLIAQAGANGTNCASGGSPGVCNFNGTLVATNLQLSVTAYGAVGDCVSSGSTAGCTDNTTAVQACVNAASAILAGCLFPPNPSASGQTVYYIGGTINPKGVSLLGPPSAGGTINDVNTVHPVVIRGAPGKDMFAPGDPADGAATTYNRNWHVRDLTFLVDDTSDVSATSPFQYRKPGKTCWDAAITSGTPTLFSASSECVFEPGDVGQAITVYSAGVAGADLTTTITGCNISYGNKNNACSSVTLAVNASTSVASGTAYISVMNLPVTAHIGNCAFAYDGRVSSVSYNGERPEFYNVNFMTVSGGNNHNKQCAFFFQGHRGPYQGRFVYTNIGSLSYGFVFVPPNQTPVSSGQLPGIADFNVFDQSWNEADYPWLSYGGNTNEISQWQLYSSIGMGPHILDGYNTGGGGYASHWKIDVPEQEGTCSGSSAIPWRVAGFSHSIGRLSVLGCSSSGETIQWDAQSTITTGLATLGNTWNITGANNKFHEVAGDYPATLNTSNVGNTFENDFNFNPFGAQVPETGYARLMTGVTQFNGSFGVPGLSRAKKAFERNHDFLDTGATNYYFNKEDLWMWPNELLANNGQTIATDATAETGINGSISGSTDFTVLSNAGVYMYVGEQLPAGLVRVYFKVKGNGSFSTTLYVDVDALGTDIHVCNTGSVSITTSWQVYSCDADLTTYGGKTFNPHILPPGTGNTLYYEWIGVRPWSTPVLAGSISGPGGTVLDTSGNIGAGGASIIIYRCLTAGSARAGALTSVSADCGTSTDSGLRSK